MEPKVTAILAELRVRPAGPDREVLQDTTCCHRRPCTPTTSSSSMSAVRLGRCRGDRGRKRWSIAICSRPSQVETRSLATRIAGGCPGAVRRGDSAPSATSRPGRVPAGHQDRPVLGHAPLCPGDSERRSAVRDAVRRASRVNDPGTLRAVRRSAGRRRGPSAWTIRMTRLASMPGNRRAERSGLTLAEVRRVVGGSVHRRRWKLSSVAGGAAIAGGSRASSASRSRVAAEKRTRSRIVSRSSSTATSVREASCGRPASERRPSVRGSARPG